MIRFPFNSRNTVRLINIFLFLSALFISSWLMFHTFSYDPRAHTLKIAYKLWSDFGAHIPLIRSFSMGDNLDRFAQGTVEYPLYPGEPIKYHFLFYMLVGVLEKLGLRIDWALNVPSILGFTALLVSLYILALTLTGSVIAAFLTIIFFLFNGSLGFIRFFALHPLSSQTLSDILHAKDFPAFAPWGPGEVTAFWNLNIYTNQRHLAAAFALVIIFILTCLRLPKLHPKKHVPLAILWGMVFGALPFFHQPTLLIVALVMATYMLFFPKLRVFLLLCGTVTVALVVPQLLPAFKNAGAAGSSSGLIQWYPGYIIHNEILKQKHIVPILIHLASFWWQNLGLHGILILAGLFIIPRRTRLVLLPIIPLFVIPNLFKFSVEASANHKFFNFVLLLGSIISAYTLVGLFHRIKRLSSHWIIGLWDYLFIGLLITLLTLSGIIDFFVILNDIKGTVVDIPANQTAAWIASHTLPNAVFLNSSYIYSPASVAGRAIYLGWPYFAWSAGYKENRSPLMRQFYESEDKRLQCQLLTRANLSYVLVEEVKNDPNLPRIDLQSFLKRAKPDFLSSDRKIAVYSRSAFCNDATSPAGTVMTKSE